jgi:2-polyprenyl-3-methyl-5-hydroxy-6-metoxy-1,4-benzoquinol methylase
MKTSLVDRGSVERLLLLVAALQSGLVDALAGPEALSADRVAQAAGTDPRASGIVLEALAAMGVMERVPVTRRGPGRGTGRAAGGEALYRFSPVGRAHLVGEGPELERSGLVHQVNKLRGWLELPEVIRTGEPSSRGLARQDVRSRALAMGERDPEVLEEIVERCFAYAGAIRTMIDVGGAVGHLTREFARRGVRATLFDREEVIPVAREFLGGDTAGMDMTGGDYTVSLPPGPFDLVYFGNVYHIYGPQTNARVTREAFAMTSPGGSIAIQGYLRGRSVEAAMFAVNMLRATKDGEVWAEAQYREWLDAAGFENIHVIDLKTTASHLVLGRRPETAAS